MHNVRTVDSEGHREADPSEHDAARLNSARRAAEDVIELIGTDNSVINVDALELAREFLEKAIAQIDIVLGD